MKGVVAIVLLSSVALAPAQHGLRFERDGQVAVLPDQKLLNVKELTLEAWIKVEPNKQFYSYVLSRNYGDLGYGIALHGRPDKVFSQAPGAKAPMGQWVHVARVISDKAEKFYVNGEIAYARERTGGIKPIDQPLYIGNSTFSGEPGGERTGFRGSIDEVRIWSKARTQDQIKATMNRYLRGNENGLLAYFPFEEGKGDILHDYTGRLLSASLGDSYQPDGTDATWSEGVPLKGSKPRIRVRR